MKKTFLVIIGSLFCLSFVTELKNDLLPKRNTSYAKGESLEYRLHYGFYNAGEATIKVFNQLFSQNDKTCYKLDVFGKSVGSFALIMKIKDNWRSYVDTVSLQPQLAYRNIQEGKYKLKEKTYFNHKTNAVTVIKEKKDKKETKNYSIPDNSHDIVSAYYYLRNVDFSKMTKGDKVSLNIFFEKKIYDFNVIYDGKEKIKVKAGKFNCIRLIPDVPKNDFFNGKNSVFLWVTDDENKIPIRIEAEIFIGAVQIDLKKYSGIRNKVNLVK